MKLRLSHLLVVLGLGGCGGCISPPEYPDEPKIEFLSVSRTDLYQQFDSVRVEFSFQDGNGDIGFQNYSGDSCNFCDSSCLEHPTLSIFVYDNRTGCLAPYNVPNIPPKGSSDAISGKVNLVVSSICCLYPDNTGCHTSTQYPLDTVIYSIQIKDRAGNLSNTITLPPLILHCN